ncbi:hypothetical protein ACFV0D_30035 [Streptomyces sp. NPDC059556]|uniref:hypothetical protein n=1 Tax=Streptomyces sp. NPDC059556 TaxID=3346863 RepID=UPI00367724B5
MADDGGDLPGGEQVAGPVELLVERGDHGVAAAQPGDLGEEPGDVGRGAGDELARRERDVAAGAEDGDRTAGVVFDQTAVAGALAPGGVGQRDEAGPDLG